MCHRAHRFTPQLPARACRQRYGEVDLLEVQREPDMLKFYQYTMATNLTEIRCRDLWYIVIAWQFYVHTVLSSESLAEGVGSFLAVTRRHNINGNMSMKHLVWSSQLRAIGLKGFGGEDGIMAYALDTHFQCSGPEGWHFVGKRIRRRTMDAVQIRNEVRLLNLLRWFQTYFKDLIVNGGMTLCKFLPTPERAMLTASAKQASRWQELKPAAKRHKISETAEEQYNPKVMDDGLWQQLKINTLSLPSCLRPGKYAR